MKGKTRDRILGVIFAICMLAGISFLLYPTVSDMTNTAQQASYIERYNKSIQSLSNKDFEEEWKKAKDYNARLCAQDSPLYEGDKVQGYDEVLNVDGNGVMGIVEIDKIDIKLPIYHGTNEKQLKGAVGHLQGSSLPIGGEGTHAVIAAHRGMTSARLFTDLDQLEIGDTFTVTVLDKILTYEVDDIQTVLPEETKSLEIQEGKDYLTLQTCTPYGVNSHRLLVRGKHIKTEDVTEEPDTIPQAVAAVAFNARNFIPVVLAGTLVLVFVTTKIIINKKRPKIEVK